jgi:putative modified peptide
MLAKLEKFVQRLVQDETFRALAQRDPARAVATFGLAGPERAGAMKLCVQMAEGRPTETEGWWV